MMDTFPENLRGKIVVPGIEVDAAASRIARQLGRDFKFSETPPLLVTIMKGGAYFSSKVRAWLNAYGIPHDHTYLGAQSYVGIQSSGDVEITPPSRNFLSGLENRPVIIMEDILDTGHTIKALYNFMAPSGAAGIETCTMIIKKIPSTFLWRALRKWGMPGHPRIRYVGTSTSNLFLIGGGLDYEQRFREDEDIRVLTPGGKDWVDSQIEGA